MQEPVRLNKFLSDVGICSRRQADRYVEEGKITVDGVKAVMGQKVTPDQDIRIMGKQIGKDSGRKIVLAFHKPRGIVCTTSEKEKDNIIDYIGYPERIYPVGRLDKDSEGLIFLTNDGALMNEILCARNYHEKEYEVRVNKEITNHFLKKMGEGVEILDTKTRPCKVRKTGERSFRIILTQGLNRQIRRMCEAQGYQVRRLRRIRIMNVTLGNLESGKYRELSTKEKKQLLDLCRNHSDSRKNRESKKDHGNKRGYRKNSMPGSRNNGGAGGK